MPRLVLTRKPGQKIVIHEVVTVAFVEMLPNGSARIGIDAPREITVRREEVEAKDGSFTNMEETSNGNDNAHGEIVVPDTGTGRGPRSADRSDGRRLPQAPWAG